MSSAEYSCKHFKSIFAYRLTVWTQIRLLLLEEQSDLGPHCLQKWLLKSQADDKADDNWLLRQAVITTLTWISLDKLYIDIPVLTCKKHVLICLSN